MKKFKLRKILLGLIFLGQLGISNAQSIGGGIFGSSSVSVNNILGLGTGVATLLGGNSSGTGGPAGTISPTFTGILTGADIVATGNVSVGSANGSNFIITPADATGTGRLAIQAGQGSAGFGGSIITYSHAHATKPGWVTAAISVSSGGRFSVNSSGLGAGTDVFTVEGANGNTSINGTLASGKITVTAAAVRLSNNFFYSGNVASGIEVPLLGMTAGDKVSVDPSGFGVLIGGTVLIPATLTLSNIPSSSGVRFLCISTTGVVTSQAAACVGT